MPKRLSHWEVWKLLIAVTGWSPTAKSSLRRQESFKELALAAFEYDLPFVIATPKQLLSGRRFTGWGCRIAEENMIWTRSSWTITRNAVVYDAMYLSDLKTYRSSYRKLRRALKQKRIRVFNPVLPAKDELYRRLTKRPIRGGRLPDTLIHITPRRVLRLLEAQNQLWLKPVYGSGGRNMAYVERTQEGRYMVTVERYQGRFLHEEMGQQEFVRLFRRLTRNRVYIAQEHIDLPAREQRKMDFRLTLQRSDSGAWTVTAITLRMGANGSNLTNYHAGGKVQSLTDPEQGIKLREQLGLSSSELAELQEFALRVARRLQSYYPTLGIIGLDVARTASGELLVYDFNGRPGRDILTDEELHRYMHSVVGFAKYLCTTT